MPSLLIHPALWSRLWTLAAESDRTIEELVDEILSEAVVEREVSNG